MAVESRRSRRTNRDSIDAPDRQLGGFDAEYLCVFVYIPVYKLLCTCWLS